MSFDREIKKVYPQDTKKLNLIVKSTSNLSKSIKLCQDEFCEPGCDNYCWNFAKRNNTIQDSIQLSPLMNLAYLPVTLSTKNIDPEKLHIQLFALISPVDKFIVTNLPDKKLKVWNLDVGDRWSEAWEGLLSIPPHILALLVSIFTFFGGLFIDRKSLSSKVKNLLKNKNRHRTKE